MGRLKRAPYTCPCCSYATSIKINMHHHLYNLKKPCPKTNHNIELTTEIKEFIIINRVYTPPAPQQINQIVNYNNTINNLVSNMDVIEKLTKYINHRDIPLLEYGDSIEQNFTKKIESLKTEPNTSEPFGVYDGLILNKNDIFEVINQVTSLAQEHCKDMNIIYDKKFDKLKLFDMGEWDTLILINGITTMLTKIQECYFNPYECYLIRKIEFSDLCYQDKMAIKEKLSEYYKFIGCFEIDPYVKDKNDLQIIYNQDDQRCDSSVEHDDDNTSLASKYLNMYSKVCNEIRTNDQNKIKKNVVDIVKKNCMKNVDELNKRVVALFNMDEEFKQMILQAK